jgi:hypothetical protein
VPPTLARAVILPFSTGLIALCLATAAPTAHFRHGESQGDVLYYERRALEMRSGEIPYHDFYFEYPPGAIPVVIAPTFSPLSYALSFRLQQWLLLVIVLLLTVLSLVRIGASPARATTAAALVGATPLLLGSVIFNRFDLWPVALVALALALLLANRVTVGMVVLGAAIATKLYPGAIAVMVVVWLARRHGVRFAARAGAMCVAAGLAVAFPFALFGFGGLGFSVYTQLSRGLEIESLGGSLLAAADRLGLYSSSVVGRLSFDFEGPVASLLLAIQTILLLAALATIAGVLVRHKSPGVDELTTAAAAAVTAVVAFGAVFSPQFMVWLIPVVPLVARPIFLPASITLGFALVFTNLWFPEHFGDLVTMNGSAAWLVLARNAAILVLLGTMLGWLLRSTSRAAV